MKKLFTVFLWMVSMQLNAQNYPINANISFSTNPDPNMENWGTGSTTLTISASTAPMSNGKIDARVIESKISVIIKKNGVKFCGTSTSSSAPSAGFNAAAKVWNGKNAVSLIGQECVLPPGEYEICVQFFGYSLAVAAAPLSEEKCKSFTIPSKEQTAYQPPQLINPSNGTVFSQEDIKKPITFRWSSVTPKPQEPVIYRIKVWQLMQGQNGIQAIRVNQPIITKDVDNLTQATISNLINGPCLPPYLCDFVWNVQAINKEGKPIGGNDGMSGTNAFTIENAKINTPLKVSTPCTPPTVNNPITGFYKLEKGKSIEIAGMVNEAAGNVTLKVYKVSNDPGFLNKLESQGVNMVSAKPIETFDFKNASKQFQGASKSFNATSSGTQNQRQSNQGNSIKATLKDGDLEQGSYYAVFQNGECESNPAPLSVLSGLHRLDVTIDTALCKGVDQNGKPTYSINVHLKNTSTVAENVTYDFNNAANITNNLAIPTNSLSNIISAGTAGSFTLASGSYPVTLGPGAQQSFTLNYTPVDGNAACLNLEIFISSAQGATKINDNTFTCVPVKFCICDYCDNIEWKIDGEKPTFVKDDAKNWFINVNQTISIPGQNIKSFKIEIISFSHKAANDNEECLTCNTNSNTFGNFASGQLKAPGWGTINGVFPVIPGGGGNTHHTLNWFTATGASTTMDAKINYSISAPPFSTLDCCDDEFSFCVRYTFTTKDCKTCSKVVCFNNIKREHKK